MDDGFKILIKTKLTQILEFYILYLFDHLIFLKFNFDIKNLFLLFFSP
jgi:hypothetical protein